MEVTHIYAVLGLLTAPVIGILLARATHDEKPLIMYYFRAIIWAFAVTAAINYTLQLERAFIATYMTIMLYVWQKRLQ